MSRVVREIRDAQGSGGSAIVDAGPWQLDFYTTFNDAGNRDEGFGQLRLTRIEYDLTTEEAVLTRDTNGGGDGAIGAGDRTMVLADHLANPTTRYFFRYWIVYDSAGSPVRYTSLVAGSKQMSQAYAVELRLVVDLNPGASPGPVYVRSTAQLRNARPL